MAPPLTLSFESYREMYRDFLPPSLPVATVDALQELIDNIISHPDDPLFREIPIASSLCIGDLLPVEGVLPSLLAAGFEESDNRESFILPKDAPLEPLVILRDELKDRIGPRNPSSPGPKELSPGSPNRGEEPKPHSLKGPDVVGARPQRSSFHFTDISPYLRAPWKYCDIVRLYESTRLQQKARDLMPLDRFRAVAKETSETLQTEMPSSSSYLPSVTVPRDFLLRPLLHWFKHEFFTWMNVPKCFRCSRVDLNGTKREVLMDRDEENPFPHPTPEEVLWLGHRVEGYSCPQCGTLQRFPRYNHSEKLLETRIGRCGEWANAFTLCARALGFPARFVMDNADHVWTEVYSEWQGRWIHCDPCEAALDQPLMYEAGWGKKLEFVMGISIDEVADVTWRYSKDHQGTRVRRKELLENFGGEEQFTLDLDMLTRKIQDLGGHNPGRRKVIAERRIRELVELLMVREVHDNELMGRQSGSAAWRIARGEIGRCTVSPNFVFSLSAPDVRRFLGDRDYMFEIRYSAVLDQYYLGSTGPNHPAPWLVDFTSGVYSAKNIIRKVEQDWNMVYLCRQPGTEEGEIIWKFDLSPRWIRRIHLRFLATFFQSGVIRARITPEGTRGGEIPIVPDGHEHVYNLANHRASSVAITVTLTGGDGDVAWQHAQLFRQADTERNPDASPFVIRFESRECD